VGVASFRLIVRRTGTTAAGIVAAAIALSISTAVAAAEPISLVSVPIDGETDLSRLERTGLDVTHDVSATDATVLLYSEADRARLSAAGFEWETLIADLQAKSAVDRAAEEDGVAVPAALPSGRSTYRVYEDYINEMNALADDPGNAGLVRRVPIGQTFEGRQIFGLEIAEDVQRTDDGRPAYVNMGLHHAREWPSGEFPMEFAIDLVNGYNAADPEITGLLEDVRVFIFPVVNADGFVASRGSAPSAGGAPVLVGGFGEFRRKNCRPAPGNPADAALPCALRPNSGVDLNRNYGYYWGGPGASTSATSESYRGTGPFSEPESEAVHGFSSDIHPTVFISNHTFTDQGWWLRQPGFNGGFFDSACPGQCAITPDETAMKALGDGMGDATGWPSDLGWELGDITGATEDWNYFAQGTYGYTPEARGLDFHSLYSDMVIEEYEGDAMHVGEGVRAAFLLAGQFAANPAHHGIIQGPAPPGSTLTLSKDFEAPTFNQPALNVDEHLETTMTAPSGGTYEWHVNPSDRPLVSGGPPPDPGDEVWTMTCRRPGGTETFTKSVEVTRNGVTNIDWGGSECGAPPAGPNLPPSADFTVTPDPPIVNQEATLTSTSIDSDGAIALTEWDLDGDNDFDEAVTGLVTTHTFTVTGDNVVRVRVTDDDGDSNVKERILQVASAPPPNQPPTANFDHFPVSPFVNEDVTFTAGAADNDGTIAAHEWDLDGDGAFDDAQGGQVTRAYTAAGTYTVSLRVTDDDGAADTGSADLVVRERTSAGCRGRAPTIFGTAGDDRGPDLILGTPGADVIAALEGDDVVVGRGGADVICGHRGRDLLRGGRGADFASGAKGPDRVLGGSGDDTLRGGAGRDVVLGGRGTDSCRFGRGGLRLLGCP
jgi:PKD repeat protein